eukprot:GHVR01185140.1.p1 GENE.GHVR01185140.1~~GHVR01185140.1.p1  ORF type:complete len:108 (-),score=5.04 GHVR01185140.1:411-734(-)
MGATHTHKQQVIQHPKNGKNGRYPYYVDTTTCQRPVRQTTRKAPSEKLITFSVVILHRDNIKRTADISRTVEKRLEKWKENRFDELLNDVLRTKTQQNKHKNTMNTP